jgi:uncharacterized oxidoreductase
MAGEQPVLRRAQELEPQIGRIFGAAGSNAREAALIARHLVEANLCGHDSHGAGVVPAYLRNARDGRLVLNRRLGTSVDTGSMLVCDGGLGAGQVMAHDAMQLGIARAREAGSCAVALRESHHVGRIGHWAEQCAAAGMVSIHFVNVVAGAYVAPFGGTVARLGTNPFAAGFPRQGGDPVIVDFATSRLAMGKIRIAHNKGETLPDGVAIGPDGRPVNDPAVMFAEPRGALTTFGGHKGWGMQLACELLGAALVGAPVQSGPDLDGGLINSMFSVIVAPDRLGTAGLYAQRLEEVAAWVTSENADGPGEVLLPGMPERRIRAERIAGGIPFDRESWEQLAAAAAGVGVSLDA